MQFTSPLGVQYTTDPVTGGITLSADGNVFPASGLRNDALRIATFGDSTASVSSTQSPSNQDTSRIVASVWNSGLVNLTISADKYMLPMAYPQAYLVCNGGITGQTTTQMLARDALATSITRYAITDVINSAPQVVLLRAGSINNLSTVTAGTLAATVSATYADHVAIISRFMSAGIPVIDEGIYGYSANTSTEPATTRAALLQLNAMYAAFAAANPLLVTFVNPVGAVSNADGTYIANCTADGTHLSVWGQYQMAKREAAALTNLFGRSTNSRYKGPNNVTNALFSSLTAPGYGDVATGFSFPFANNTRQNAKIETINGKVFNTCEFVITAAANTASVTIPYNPSGSGSMAILVGDMWGFEFDIYIAGLNGYQPNVNVLQARLDTRNTVGSGRVMLDVLNASNTVYGQFTDEFSGHIVFPPLQYGDVSANLTTASALSFVVGTSDTSGTLKIGVSMPRIVKLGQTVTTS